jgi:uncharacterized membrane protein
MFYTINYALGMMMSTFHMLVSLGFLLIWLYLMWKSYEGKKVVLPIIGPLAEKQAGA